MDQDLAKSIAAPPLISVVMSVYNGEQFLAEAIDSILSQSFTNFEFIIVNDGSTDDSLSIIQNYSDKRIKLITQNNHGLVYSLNHAISEARGDFIARMDADDVSMPQRLDHLLSFMQLHQEIVVVGSSFEVITEQGKPLYIEAVLVDNSDVRRTMYLRNPLGHGTVMVRRQALLDAGGYGPEAQHVEDFDLWRRLSFERGKLFAALPEVLYRWRANSSGISNQNTAVQTRGTRHILDAIWSQNSPKTSARSYMRRRSGYYRHLPHIGPQLQERYLQNELSIALAMIRRGYVGRGMHQFLAFMLLGDDNTTVTLRFCTSSLYRRIVHYKNKAVITIRRQLSRI